MAQLNDLVVTGSSRFLNTINGNINGNAATGSKVYVTNLHPTTATTSNLIYTIDTTDNNVNLYTDAAIRYRALEGTAASEGLSRLILGNSIASGTTSNQTGKICLYGPNTGYAELLYANSTSSTSHTFPATDGTILNTGTTSFTQTLTSGTKIGSIKINNTSTDIYAPTNTNNAVTQTATTTNANYEILFSGTADNTTRTEGAKKTSTFTYNPSNNSLLVGTLKSGTTIGQYATAFGSDLTASGSYSHVEGNQSTASGNYSHAEGSSTTASGQYGSHSEGGSTTASGNSAHAEGFGSTASGYYSHAQGYYTTASHKSQHVFGEYNSPDGSTASYTSRGNYVEIVGNGTGSSAKSNARTLNWNGNEWIAGTLTQGSSIEIKKNVADMTQEDGDKILNLRPVVFDYKSSEKDIQAERGFIAEEVKEIIPNLVTDKIVNDEGETVAPASLNYIAMIPYLVKVCQRQQKEIDTLKSLISEK